MISEVIEDGLASIEALSGQLSGRLNGQAKLEDLGDIKGSMTAPEIVAILGRFHPARVKGLGHSLDGAFGVLNGGDTASVESVAHSPLIRILGVEII